MRYLSPDKEMYFPNLRLRGYKATSRQTEGRKTKYNCVGWAAQGDRKKWWEAAKTSNPAFYWPTRLNFGESLQTYFSLFEVLGYTACASDKVEPLFENIAVYTDDGIDFSHVAYQLYFGWTSKLGDWEDIKHRTLDALDCNLYGKAVVIMKRRCRLRGFVARAFFNVVSWIWPVKRLP